MKPFDFRGKNNPDITHWAGYLEYLSHRRGQFPMIAIGDLQSLTPTERLAYDSARLDFLSDNIVVRNETVLNIADVLATVMELNRGKPKGGYGVFVSAPSGRGKTTALHAVVQDVLLSYIKSDPHCITDNHCCPVAYICIPDSGTPKSIYMEIADYLGIEYKPRDSDPVMRKLVLAGIANSGVEVFVIDEIQNLENGGAYAKRAADAVRRLADDTATTYILAGINLEITSFMTEARGLQIANRVLHAEVAEYGKQSDNWRGRWKGLVTAMADALPLYATGREELRPLAEELHHMCHGSVQALNLILTQTARDLIELPDPTQETVTLERLKGTRVNLATERHVDAELERTRAKATRAAKAVRAGKPPPSAPPNAGA